MSPIMSAIKRVDGCLHATEGCDVATFPRVPMVQTLESLKQCALAYQFLAPTVET